MWYGRSSEEGWTDRGSVPDIRNGFIDGYFDFVADHPIRALNRIDSKSLGVISAAMLIDSMF